MNSKVKKTKEQHSNNNLPQSEKKLFDLATRLKNIYDISPGLICVANANDGIFTECNPAVTSILGWSVKEFTSKPFNDFIHPDDQQKTVDEITEQLKGALVANFENRYRCKDGSYKWLAWQATAVDKNGKVYAVATDITDRKQASVALIAAKEKVEQSEKYLNNIINNIGDPVFVKDDQSRLVIVNDAFCNIFGKLNRADIIGKTLAENVSPKERESFLRIDKQVLKDGHENINEETLTLEDEDTRTISTRKTRFIDKNGKKFLIGVIHDITERKHAEEALKTNEEKYKALFEKIEDAVFISDPITYKILDANKATSKIYGYSKKELIGMSCLNFSAEVEKSISAAEKMNKNEKINGSDRIHQKKDGAIIIVEIKGYQITLGKKKVNIAISRDITLRKTADKKIAKNSKQRAKLLNNARTLSSSLDYQFILDKVTSQALELLDSIGAAIYILDDDKEYLKPVSAYDPPYESETLSNDINVKKSLSGKAVRSKKGMIFNNASLNPDAYQIPGTSDDEDEHLMVIPLLIENKVIGTLNIYRRAKEYEKEDLELAETFTLLASTAIQNAQAHEELTGHREHLEELVDERTAKLQEQNLELNIKSKEVEEANRLKSEFLSNMSHELRTPLNSIMSLSHVLSIQAKDKLSFEENNFLEIIERNGRKLLELINDILDLSKIETGKVDIVTGKTSTGQLLDIIKDNLTPLAEEKGIGLNLKLPKKLPMVVTDEPKLHQVFTNVIGNAVKFTEKGSVDIIVKSDSENVYVDIKDTGIGISEEALPHIFDEFRQADGSTTRKYEGTGLGLAIAYKTIKLLGGTIRVKSKLGKGSVFTITVPIKWMGIVETTYKETKPITKPKNKTAKKTTKKVKSMKELKNVLIVEDNLDNMVAVKAILKDKFNIIEAYDGEEGLNKANEELPDIILLDMALPKVSGIEVIKKLKSKKETKKIPVITLTAHAMEEMKELFLRVGCDDFVSKPIDQDVLLNTMNKWLDK